MIGLMASVQHQKSALPLRGLVKPLSQVLLSVLCSGEDLELRISRDLDDLESGDEADLGTAGILARMNFFALLGLADSMRGRRISDLVGGVVHDA